ncbi:hypothetical protein D3C72_1743530 [compost metagenome]
MYTALVRLSSSLNSGRDSTARSLALQLTHQSAVMLTNTTRLSARRRSSICGEYSTTFSLLACAARAGGASWVTAHTGTSAAITSSTPSSPAARWLRQRLRSNSHRPPVSSSRPPSASAMPSTPRCLPSTHSSHNAAAYIGKASTCFRVSIHWPGLGRRRASAGTKPISRNGRARPRPRNRNTSIAATGGATKA